MLSAARVGWYEKHIVAPLKECSGSEIVMRGIVTDVSDKSFTLRGRVQSNGIMTTVTFDRSGCDIACGDSAEVICEVSTPQKTLTFDSEEYDRTSGVFLECSGVPAVRLLNKPRDPIIGALKRLRDYSIGNIRQRLPDQDGAFLTAILCSDKSALTAESSSAVYRSGLGHLFAVSGTHVVILCSFIGIFLDLMFCPSRVRSVVMILFCVSFMVFSGCSPSVVRAGIMMSLCEAGGLFNRQNDSPTALGLAAILITARCPYAMFSLSFMLSFTAAFAIGSAAPAICRRRISDPTARKAAAVMTVNALTAPICAWRFSELSLIAAASNLVMIPLCSVCLWLCFLYMLTGCTLTPLLAAAGLAARVILKICTMISASRLSFAGTYFRPQMIYVAVIAAVVFAVCALIRGRRKTVILAVVSAYALLMMGWFVCDRLPKSDSLTVYPSKYGYTAVVERGSEVLIFDSGGFYSNAYAAARLTERRHPEQVFVYTPKDNEKAYTRYREVMSGISDFCCPARPEGINRSGGCDFAKFNDRDLTATVHGSRLIFDKKGFTLDGRKYEYHKFSDISTFYLK